MSSTKILKSFYARTSIFQGETEFHNTWDFSGEADNASAVIHLTELLGQAADAFQETYEKGGKINFYGMSPWEFANVLVLNEKAALQKFATTWEISTQFQEVDAEWEHPCNL